MKGFVPVSKDSFATMLEACLVEIERATIELTGKTVKQIVDNEVKRSITRRWYRLWTLPKPRFEYFQKDVIEWANAFEYPMFEGSPFIAIEQDRANSIAWVNRLKRVAENNHAGEPILLDMKTFQRISEPARYYWVTTGWFTSVRED